MTQRPSAILLGSKPGAVVALELMKRRNWNIRAVVPSGSHDFIEGEKLHEAAHRFGIDIRSQDELSGEKVDFVISYMFRNRVKPRTLALANRAALNFHAAPLPEYGGWAFYNLAILENATEYGCTCHHMDEGFDSGPLMKVRKFPIDPAEETAFSLERKAQEEMIQLFIEFMMMAESGKELPKIAQEKEKMRYLTKEQFSALKEIPLTADHETAQRIARAFFYPPYECAYINVSNNKLEIIPEIAKLAISTRLHEDDLARLRKIASQCGG